MTEDQLEQETLSWLSELGYTVHSGYDIAHDGPNPQRANYREVVLASRLRTALQRLNPDVPNSALDDALHQVLDLGVPSLLRIPLMADSDSTFIADSVPCDGGHLCWMS